MGATEGDDDKNVMTAGIFVFNISSCEFRDSATDPCPAEQQPSRASAPSTGIVSRTSISSRLASERVISGGERGVLCPLPHPPPASRDGSSSTRALLTNASLTTAKSMLFISIACFPTIFLTIENNFKQPLITLAIDQDVSQSLHRRNSC